MGMDGRSTAQSGTAHQRVHALRSMLVASVSGVHLDIEPLVKHLSRGHQEPVLIRNDIADVVWQSAIGERDIGTAIEHENLNGFI
jgi:hypothetical protein